MGRKNKRKNSLRSDNVFPIGYGGAMVPYAKRYAHWYQPVDPKKIKKIANQVFGGTYYCVGDRKSGRKPEES